MRLVVLGSAGSYAARGRPASGFLIRSGATDILIDAGPGTFMRLLEHSDPAHLAAAVISHRHPDHSADLLALFHYLAYGPDRHRLPMYVPEGGAQAVAAFLDAGDDHAVWKIFDWRTVTEGDSALVGAVQLSFARTAHPVPTVAVRAEADGRILVYSADTGPGGGLPRLAEGAHLLLCEATFQGELGGQPYPHHLTAGEAGALAARAGCERLLLTHLIPSLDAERSLAEARVEFDGPVATAEPDMEVEV